MQFFLDFLNFWLSICIKYVFILRYSITFPNFQQILQVLSANPKFMILPWCYPSHSWPQRHRCGYPHHSWQRRLYPPTQQSMTRRKKTVRHKTPIDLTTSQVEIKTRKFITASFFCITFKVPISFVKPFLAQKQQQCCQQCQHPI